MRAGGHHSHATKTDDLDAKAEGASASRTSATWLKRMSISAPPVKGSHHYTNEENGLVLRRYWTNPCQLRHQT